jgi:hypothetical protein
MATTYTDNGGSVNGSNLVFTFSFPYIKTEDVKVALNGTTQASTKYTVSTSPTKITFNNTSVDSTVQESTGAPKSGVTVRVFRDTDVDNPRAVYAAGSSIRALDLNNNVDQILYAQQENQNQVNTVVTTTWKGLMSHTDKVKIDGVETAATADQTDAEIRAAVEAASDSNVFTDADHSKLNAIEASATADQTNAEIRTAVEAATDSNVFTDADHTKLNGIAASANNYAISSDLLDEDDFATDSATKVPSQQSTKAYIGTYSQPKDADLTTLSGMQTGAAAKVALLTADEVEKLDQLTASTAELNKLDGVTASTADINQIQGLAKQTTITDDDAKFPTSGAVVDYVASALQPFGGFEAVADEDNFPATQPASGVVISINDAAGVVINGSGVSTTARTAGNGSDNVTINGFPSSLYNETLAAGVGLQVSSTGSSNTYTYHKILASETDVKQLSDDINDFNSRYRIASSAPGSANDEGDLYFDTGTNKMYVYDGSSWGEVTSTGDFKYLFLSEVGNNSAASYDNSKVSFDLHEGSVSGSLASITSAAQLMVSINGVVQKPNTGTNTSGLDGFVMTDGHTIKFTAGVPTNANVFVIQSGSALAINVTGDNTVSEAKLNVSNSPTNGYYLQAQSGNTGGLTWAAVSQYTTPLTTRGDILFRDASGDQRLAKGTAGQYLKQGANDPEWADVVGAVADGCIFENDQTISNNYTIASGKGAHSVGPLTVNATVTVNGVWVIS